MTFGDGCSFLVNKPPNEKNEKRKGFNSGEFMS
jgi:hypothetical protein